MKFFNNDGEPMPPGARIPIPSSEWQFDLARAQYSQFNGVCGVCHKVTVAHKSLIAPNLSVKNTIGNPTWVHFECAKRIIDARATQQPDPKKPSRFFLDPPASARQKSALVQNVEEVLKQLMANPTKKFRIVFDDAATAATDEAETLQSL
jgi:hypothetical protein